MKRAIAWFVHNHVTANLLMVLILLAGVLTALDITVEVFPEVSLDEVVITVEYPRASPSEVEEAVLRKIEEEVVGIKGVKEIVSEAREGMGTVRVEVLEGWDLDELLDEVKTKVEALAFPEEAERPVIRKAVATRRVINVALYGHVPEGVLKALAEEVRDGITRLEGVTKADLLGVPEAEIHVEVPEEALRRYGLTLAEVAEAIRRHSFDLPLGEVKTVREEILLRAKGRRLEADDFRDIPLIARPDGAIVTLGQVAILKEGFREEDLLTRFMGKPAAMIQVWRVGDQSAIEVAKEVRRYVERIRDRLPPGVDIATFMDMSRILKDRLSLLLRNMAIGMVLVVAILGVFLRPRLAFWITLGIPISFAAGLALLPRADVSINMASLFAFILVLGIVVDDAIVIGENVFRRRQEGLRRVEAAIVGASEIAGPVVFAVLTTVAAFLPLLMAGGMVGRLLRNIPVVVIAVLMGSLFEALFILPAHLSRSRAKGGQGPVSRGFEGFVRGPYRRLLAWALRWRYAVVAAGLALLMVSLGLWKGGRLKFTFFPRVESDYVVCYLTMPPGTPLERTLEVVKHLEATGERAVADLQQTEGLPLLKNISSLVGIQWGRHDQPGGRGAHVAQVIMELVEAQRRPGVSSREVVAQWRRLAGAIPEAQEVVFSSELFTPGPPVAVDLYHQDSQVLLGASEELKKELKNYRGVFDIASSPIPGKEEIRLRLKPVARTLGLSLRDLALQVRHAFYGVEALSFQRGHDEVRVMVRWPEEERHSLGRLGEMRVRLAGGQTVPLKEVAELCPSREYLTIKRVDRRRVVTITADVDERVANADEIRRDLAERVLPSLVGRYGGLDWSFKGEGGEMAESMKDVERGFLLALFLIYLLLAIPFASFSQPLLVMAAIPFGVVGAFAGHLIMGYDLSILSFFGIVGLSGVVVNDSLILINAVNRLRKSGLSVHDAVLQGGVLRFRAVILTTLTTFAGLAPLIFERSVQARFLIPMALSLGFGVFFATAITLVLIPCGYVILEELRRGN